MMPAPGRASTVIASSLLSKGLALSTSATHFSIAQYAHIDMVAFL